MNEEEIRNLIKSKLQNMRINTQFAPLNQTLNELYYEKGF